MINRWYKMKIINAMTVFVVVLIVAIILTGCATTQGTTNSTGANNQKNITQTQNLEPIKIGWIGPQTGQSAVLGMDSAVSAQIAVDEINAKGGINGRSVSLIIEDDQYDIAKATTAYQKLVNVDGVKFILINTYGSVFALAKNAEADGVILIDPLDCNSELAGLSDNVFCLATDSESIAEVLSQDANKKNYSSVGILYWNSDLFMPLVEKVFRKDFNGEIVDSEPYV